MIYIVRHGQTDYNVEGRYGGRIDVNLNEKGINQALEIKNNLQGKKFDVVISSPLSRAITTAKIIIGDDKDIIVDERIIERDNGSFEGKLKTEVANDYDFNNPNDHRYGIENIVDFRKRIDDFCEDIIKKYEDEDVLIVTHAGVGIYIRCFFEGEPMDNNYLSYKLKNCEVLKYDNSKMKQKVLKLKEVVTYENEKRK